MRAQTPSCNGITYNTANVGGIFTEQSGPGSENFERGNRHRQQAGSVNSLCVWWFCLVWVCSWDLPYRCGDFMQTYGLQALRTVLWHWVHSGHSRIFIAEVATDLHFREHQKGTLEHRQQILWWPLPPLSKHLCLPQGHSECNSRL